jgi:hypothetical protein
MADDVEALTCSQVIGLLWGSPEDLTPWDHWYPRVSRPCYDKFKRCPGWAGGGTRTARVRRCDNGFLYDHYDKKLWEWRFARCPKCNVLVLPSKVRWLDWRYVWGWKLREVPGDFREWWKDNFSWGEEDTGEWAAYAGPLEVLRRAPGVLRREARYRITIFMIKHGR